MGIAISKAYKKRAYRAEDWIGEKEACKLLGITKKTLGNKIYAGKIPEIYISVGVGGNRFFHKPGLMGFDN